MDDTKKLIQITQANPELTSRLKNLQVVQRIGVETFSLKRENITPPRVSGV
jgi:hypothetical protein